MAGILHPRILVSPEIVAALTPEQLTAALRHEHAHQLAGDNFKRLCLVMAPGVLPFHSGFQTLERAWARFAEWAADDYAASGDPLHSTALAAALVRVARMAPASASLLVTTLIDGESDLAVRVDRLLNPTLSAVVTWSAFVPLAAGGFVLGCSMALLQRGTLPAVHSVLEHLLR